MTIHPSRSIARFLTATCAAVVLAACAGMSMPGKVADGVMTDPAGKTLYTFARDPAGGGKSVCNGPCAANWPAFVAAPTASASGDWTIVTRDDGTKQWAYQGKPLYTFSKDAKPGDRNGDGFLNGAWHVVRG